MRRVLDWLRVVGHPTSTAGALALSLMVLLQKAVSTIWTPRRCLSCVGRTDCRRRGESWESHDSAEEPLWSKSDSEKDHLDVSPGNSNRVQTKLARKNSRQFSCIFTHLQKRGVLQQNQSWEHHRDYMGASPGITLRLSGAPPASAGPRNMSQAYGRRAESSFPVFGPASPLSPCLRSRTWMRTHDSSP